MGKETFDLVQPRQSNSRPSLVCAGSCTCHCSRGLLNEQDGSHPCGNDAKARRRYRRYATTDPSGRIELTCNRTSEKAETLETIVCCMLAFLELMRCEGGRMVCKHPCSSDDDLEYEGIRLPKSGVSKPQRALTGRQDI